jgi:hypothetical protein
MSKLRIVIGTLAASACAVAQAEVPTRAQLQHAFAEMCPGVKVLTLRCQDASPEEPTEAECHYSARKSGKVLKEKSMFFVDATGWHLMDQSDSGQCPGKK